MTDDKRTALKEKLRELERWDMAERRRLLDAHHKERYRRSLELEKECEELGGHEMYALPNNGINHLNFRGEWPHMCRWCGKYGYQRG